MSFAARRSLVFLLISGFQMQYSAYKKTRHRIRKQQMQMMNKTVDKALIDSGLRMSVSSMKVEPMDTIAMRRPNSTASAIFACWSKYGHQDMWATRLAVRTKVRI